jgi:peptidoglycan/LPS O-acetylase OafA/YrhL
VIVAAIAFVLRSDVPKVGPFYYLAADGVFFLLGMTFRDWLRRPREKVGMALLLGFVGFIAAQLALAAYRGTLGQVPQGLLDLAVALVSIGFVIALSRAWKAGWLLVLGQQSMAIYLLHTFFASGGRIVLARFLGVERLDVHLIAGTALGILLPLVCARFVEKRRLEGIFSIPSRWRLAARRGHKPEFAS